MASIRAPPCTPPPARLPLSLPGDGFARRSQSGEVRVHVHVERAALRPRDRRGDGYLVPHRRRRRGRVEAGRWALERALKPMVMICGGLDKHLDYSPLKSLVEKKVKNMMAIGQAREIMKDTFGDVVKVDTFTSLDEAIQAAQRIAEAGDCVLFSPMCASFDMFKDYEDRGRCFKEIVNSLK